MNQNPHALLYLIVRRILDDQTPFSRNQNFEAYNDALVRQARRIATFLERVSQSVLSMQGSEHRLHVLRRTSGGEIVLGIHGERVRFEHTLNPNQWQVLRAQRRVVHVLSEHIPDLHEPARAQARALLEESTAE